MRRTTFRLALATGASAVLLSAGPALATTPPDDWADRFSELSGYSGVSCLVSTIPGGESSVFISEQQWSPLLQGDNEYLGVALELADGTAEHSPFLGYGEDHIYSSSAGESIERAVVCQGAPEGEAAPADPAEDADETAEDDAAEDEAADDDATEDEADEDEAADEDADDEGADGDATDEDATDEDADEASGPPVETDGPSSMSGANLGLIGGAALALAGVGITGFALRRRA